MCFQISAAATGVIKNGVITRILSSARPRNFLSSKSASKSPRSVEKKTTPDVKTTEFLIAARIASSAATV